jgi:hypothetical protein
MDNQLDFESDILQQLDDYATEYDFPMLNNIYFLNADIRLTVFKNDSEWLMIFEEIAFDIKQKSFINSVSAYGNQIEQPGTQTAVDIISEIPRKLMWDEDGNFTINLYDFEVIINNEIKHFALSSNDYHLAGIDTESKMEKPAKILRLLTFIYPNQFFLSEEQLLGICGKKNF